jgi:hypothetical protein
MTEYDDVVTNVAASLNAKIVARRIGIQSGCRSLILSALRRDWRHPLLLKSMPEIRSITGNVPLLLGTSERIHWEAYWCWMQDRDPGTIASTVAAICIREKGKLQHRTCAQCSRYEAGIVVMDAIRNAK